MRRNIYKSNVYKLVLVSLMVAITLVLNRLIPSTPLYHLTCDFVPVFIIAFLFGPLWSALTYAVADTLGSLIFPTGPFNPGITLTLAVLGAAFGLIYYKKNCTGKWVWIRASFAALAALVIKLFGTTYFLYLAYGGVNGLGYLAYVISRIPNCVIFACLVLVLLPLTQKLIIERIEH